jgi:outer membrane lipoprotein SlyB
MDNPSSPSRLHPLVIAATVSIILFCGVGIAAITGLLPHAKSDEAPVAAVNADAASAPDAKAGAKEVPAVPEARKEVSVAAAPVHRHVEKRVAEYTPPPAPVCYECGTVMSVETVQVQGDTNGVGAVGGAVVGGVVGHQFGNGKGKTALTALGAIGGALAGNQVEKTQRRSTRYDVAVRMEDGSSRTVSYTTVPPFSSGDRVRVSGDTLIRN